MSSRGLPFFSLGAMLAALVLLLPQTSVEARAKSGCRAQRPKRFLMRSSYVKHGMLEPRAHAAAVRYRTERYGSIPGIAESVTNPKRIADQVVHTTFFGLPITMHQKVAPILSCVEKRLKQRCSGPDGHYVPQAIGGLRTENTIRQGEISNHLFGIAIDIDPNRNPCCHCVKKWQGHRKCSIPSNSPFDRADLPKCWVAAFEHFGFYWLGRDTLEDTMHFEFLGDPG